MGDAAIQFERAQEGCKHLGVDHADVVVAIIGVIRRSGRAEGKGRRP